MWRLLSLLIAVIAFAPAMPPQAAADASVSWPTDAWPVSTPEAQHMDPALIDRLDAQFARGDYGYIDHMLIIRDGHVVFDRAYPHDYVQISGDLARPPGMYNYYDPQWHPYYQGTDLHSLQSVTKSITSLAIGVAMMRGEIPGLETSIAGYFTDYRIPAVEEKRGITLGDLLSMRAGIQWDETTYPYTNARNSCGQMEHQEDWVRYVLEQPMADKPGTTFVYNSGASQLLSHILRQATGQTVDQYLQRRIFAPLGIEKYYWKHTPTGLPDTEGGLYMTPADLAKIGYLYLHDGVWAGRRLLPEGWVMNTLTARSHNVTSRGARYDYGLQWWLLNNPDDSGAVVYAARGYGGQLLYIVPEENLIAVFTGWNIYEHTEVLPARVLFDFILKSTATAGDRAGPQANPQRPG